jgi:hypothetical protein
VRRLLTASSVALLALFAAGALAAGGHDHVVGNCTKSQVKPTTIVLACADDNAYVSHISWSSFGGATASGSGQFYDNPCTPNCAASKDQVTAVSFSLSRPRRCPGGVKDYRRMSITFTAAPPKHYGLHYSPGLYCPIP